MNVARLPMTDTVSPERRSEIMAKIRPKGTKPEMLVRRLVHSMGQRYRLHQKDLPGKPDLVFRGRRKAIFVHGCFWHQHTDPGCKIARKPKSNTSYWLPKLTRNVERDEEHQAKFRELCWDVLIVWECETKDDHTLFRKISQFLQYP